MCGRFTLHHTSSEVAARFGVQKVLFEVSPRYNIAPGQPIAAITQNGERTLDGFKWGLVPFWAKDANIGHRLINARAETLAEKPAFKSALQRRRCLIPADGFYEWQQNASQSTSLSPAKSRQPMHIHLRGGELFAFAGLWDEWKPKDAPDDAEPLRTCTIMTTAPNALLSTMHHRMAAILRPEDEAAWLDPALDDAAKVLSLLQPYPDDALDAYAISTKVNAPAFDAPDCIAPLVDDEGVMQGTLF